jgi:hypothetical protein
MNNFETPQGQTPEERQTPPQEESSMKKPEMIHLRDEHIEKYVNGLRGYKEFKLTETDKEYILVVNKEGGEITSVITKSGDEETDKGALFEEIVRPHLPEQYPGM